MWHAANTKKTLCFALSARIVSLMAVALFVLASAAFAAKFESDLCPADQAVALAKLKASCGYLIVPENRTKKKSAHHPVTRGDNTVPVAATTVGPHRLHGRRSWRQRDCPGRNSR